MHRTAVAVPQEQIPNDPVRERHVVRVRVFHAGCCGCSWLLLLFVVVVVVVGVVVVVVVVVVVYVVVVYVVVVYVVIVVQ